MKWDGQIENFYFLAIVHCKDLKSIRDLTGNHLKLLENLYDKSLEVIKQKYNINSNKLKIYFHYQPSFYHLHVHFSHIKYEVANVAAGRAHLLKNVIENIKLCPDYYQKASLSFMIKKDDAFYKLYEPIVCQNL
jgi:m7GpppX diphosphatase